MISASNSLKFKFIIFGITSNSYRILLYWNLFEIPNIFTQDCTIKFTIIIPVYTILNRYLIDLIETLNKQSYQNYEIYIVGNESCSVIDGINNRKIKRKI